MRIKEEILINIFEESFKDKIKCTCNKSSSISFIGHRYSMEYNFLEGYISLHEWPKVIGVIYMSGGDIFSENKFDDFIYDVRLFEHKIKKLIKYNKRKTRRKFTAR